MPLGLMKAPSTFQRTLDVLLKRYNWESCLVYLEDISIFSNNLWTYLLEVERGFGNPPPIRRVHKIQEMRIFRHVDQVPSHIIKPWKLCLNDDPTRRLVQ